MTLQDTSADLKSYTMPSEGNAGLRHVTKATGLLNLTKDMKQYFHIKVHQSNRYLKLGKKTISSFKKLSN